MTAIFNRRNTYSILLGLALLTNSSGIALAETANLNGANVTQASSAVSNEGDSKRKAIVVGLWSKYHRCGLDAMQKGDNEGALQMLGKAVEEAELVKLCRPEMAETFDALAEVYRRNGNSSDSLLAGLKALEIRSSFGGTGGAGKIASLVKIGELYREAGDLQKAKASLKEAVNLAKASNDNSLLRQTALEGLARMALVDKDLPLARTYLDTLMQLDLQGAAGLHSAKHLELSAILSWQEGKFGDASKCMEQALQIRSSFQKSDNPEFIACMRNYVRANLTLGKTDGLAKMVASLLAFDRKNIAPDAADYLCDLQSLADLKFSAGEVSAARQLCDEIAKADAIAKNKDLVAKADLLSLQAKIAAQGKQWHEAKSLAEQAIAAREKLGLPELLSVNECETIANVDFAQGQFADAEASIQRVITLRTKNFGTEDLGVQKANGLLKLLSERSAATTANLKTERPQ